jgi:peptide/nickel transport system substrate-binding protein/oligopeptide transport system substrate-binding protein
LPSPDDSDQTTRKINLTAVSGKLATAQFSNAKVDLVLGGTFADYPRISRLALGKNKPRLDPVTGLFGLSLTHTNGLLSNPTARQAIAMAIDREAIASALSAPTYISTTRLLPPGIADDSGQVDERWTGKSMAERQQSASAIIARWITAKHHNANLTLALPTGPGADLLYNRLKTDLGQISITLTRVSDNAPADLRLIDTVARYARSAWFLHQLDCTANRGPCTASADRLAARANLAETPKKSTDLAAQAEALHLQNNVYIPLGTPIRWSLVGTKINTFTVNRWGQHPLPTLATTRK